MTHSPTPLWPSDEWQMPARSRLYAITPQGKGTVMVEALHSLVIRLAHAHVVKPAVLVKEEILRDCDINYTKYSAKFVTTYLSTMNGLGKYAREIKDSLETLTMQSGLDDCTFLRWDGLFEYRSRRMLHLHPHWCPCCFYDWRQSGIEPYYPLIWQSVIVRHCPIHLVPLQEKCPGCHKAQPFVPRHYYLDHCSYCGGALAGREVGAGNAQFAPITANAQHAIDTVSEMITRGPSIEHLLTATHFWSKVQETADLYCEGKIKSLEKALGFAEGTFSNWKLGRHKPSFVAFYRFARTLDTTPVRFLVEGVSGTFCPPKLEARSPRRARKILTTAELDALRIALRAVIAQGHSQQPMRDIAARLGHSHSFMIYWFSDECRQISQLHRRWVASRANTRMIGNRALAARIAETLYAGRRRVTRRLIERELAKADLSLQDPVVRDSVYAVRTCYLASRRRSKEGR